MFIKNLILFFSFSLTAVFASAATEVYQDQNFFILLETPAKEDASMDLYLIDADHKEKQLQEVQVQYAALQEKLSQYTEEIEKMKDQDAAKKLSAQALAEYAKETQRLAEAIVMKADFYKTVQSGEEVAVKSKSKSFEVSFSVYQDESNGKITNGIDYEISYANGGGSSGNLVNYEGQPKLMAEKIPNTKSILIRQESSKK